MTVRIKTDAGGRMGLRSRLEWLLVAMESGRYGESVHTGNREFEGDYMAATGAQTYVMRDGRTRPRELVADLAELVERGQAVRSKLLIKGPKCTKSYAQFALTTKGRTDAQVIIARTPEKASTAKPMDDAALSVAIEHTK